MSKLTIITVVRNGSATVRDCIESVLNQNFKAEYIIIDGNSTDSTLEIIDEYKSHVDKVISEPDDGLYDGMNKGLSLATGEIIGFLHADDIYTDGTILSRVIDIMEIEQSDACYGDLVYVDSKNLNRITRYWISGPYSVSRFYWGWMPPHPTFFARRKVYKKFGFYRNNLGTAADYELMLRLLVKHEISVSYIPEVLVKMRTGGKSNAVLKTRLKANLMDRKAWKLNKLVPYPWTLHMKPLIKLKQYWPRRRKKL